MSSTKYISFLSSGFRGKKNLNLPPFQKMVNVTSNKMFSLVILGELETSLPERPVGFLPSETEGTQSRTASKFWVQSIPVFGLDGRLAGLCRVNPVSAGVRSLMRSGPRFCRELQAQIRTGLHILRPCRAAELRGALAFDRTGLLLSWARCGLRKIFAQTFGASQSRVTSSGSAKQKKKKEAQKQVSCGTRFRWLSVHGASATLDH